MNESMRVDLEDEPLVARASREDESSTTIAFRSFAGVDARRRARERMNECMHACIRAIHRDHRGMDF